MYLLDTDAIMKQYADLERYALKMAEGIDWANVARMEREALDYARNCEAAMTVLDVPFLKGHAPRTPNRKRDQQKVIQDLKRKVIALERERDILAEENALLDEPPRLQCNDDDWK